MRISHEKFHWIFISFNFIVYLIMLASSSEETRSTVLNIL